MSLYPLDYPEQVSRAERMIIEASERDRFLAHLANSAKYWIGTPGMPGDPEGAAAKLSGLAHTLCVLVAGNAGLEPPYALSPTDDLDTDIAGEHMNEYLYPVGRIAGHVEAGTATNYSPPAAVEVFLRKVWDSITARAEPEAPDDERMWAFVEDLLAVIEDGYELRRLYCHPQTGEVLRAGEDIAAGLVKAWHAIPR